MQTRTHAHALSAWRCLAPLSRLLTLCCNVCGHVLPCRYDLNESAAYVYQAPCIASAVQSPARTQTGNPVLGGCSKC